MPASTFRSNRLQVGGVNLSTYTANATLGAADHVVRADATGGSITITLPSPSGTPPPPLGEIAGVSASGTWVDKEYVIKKIDSTSNIVYIATTGAETIDGYTGANSIPLVFQYEQVRLVSDGTNWMVLGDLRALRKLGPTTVSLIATGQTTLFTVPTGRTFKLTKTNIESLATMSGGTSSVLKIGTTANSYAEILSSSGITFVAATATTLLPTGQGVDPEIIGSNPATMSVNKTRSYAAGSVIQASVSGTVLTVGSVAIELYGYLI